MIESLLCCHFHILVGIFHYITWLIYSNDGLPQLALGLREQASWMHTHLVSFVELSYIYRSSASVAWQSLLLALTSIDGHLPSPLIIRVDVRLSPFCLLHITPSLYSIPPIMLYPWLALMCCVKVYRFEITKVWNNCLACHRGCAWWEHSCVTKMEHDQTIWFCRDELSLAMLFWEDMIA